MKNYMTTLKNHMPTNCTTYKMNKFLETFSIPKLNQEEIEILNRTIISNEIELVIKKLLTKVQDQMDSQANSIRHLKKS